MQTLPRGTVPTALCRNTTWDNSKNWLTWLNQKGNTMSVTVPAEERKAVTVLSRAFSLSTRLFTCRCWCGGISSSPSLLQLLFSQELGLEALKKGTGAAVVTNSTAPELLALLCVWHISSNTNSELSCSSPSLALPWAWSTAPSSGLASWAFCLQQCWGGQAKEGWGKVCAPSSWEGSWRKRKEMSWSFCVFEGAVTYSVACDHPTHHS